MSAAASWYLSACWAPLLDALTVTRVVQTTCYGRGTTGIYSPPQNSRHALTLQLTTPPGRETDAFYQELLGIALGSPLVQHVPVQAFSNYQAAIRWFCHASNPMGSSIGHLQYGLLLLGIRNLMYEMPQLIPYSGRNPIPNVPDRVWIGLQMTRPYIWQTS